MNNTPPAPLAWVTLQLAGCNVLNLSAVQRQTYANQAPHDAETCARKVEWLGAQIARLKADAMGFQGVRDESALREAIERSGWRQAHISAPGAEQSATGMPLAGSRAAPERVMADELIAVSPSAKGCQAPIRR